MTVRYTWFGILSARLAIVVLVTVTIPYEGHAAEGQCASPFRPSALFISYSKPNVSDDCSPTDHVVLNTRSGENLCVCESDEWVPSVKTYVE